MPTLKTKTKHLNHPLARIIPWEVWRNHPFYFSASDAELQRAQGPVESASTPLQYGDRPLQSLLCLLYGHSDAQAESLLNAAQDMGCDNTTIVSAAATAGRIDLLDALTRTLTPALRVQALVSDNYGAFCFAAENGHLNILEHLDGLMTETQKQEALLAYGSEAFCSAAANGHLNILEHLDGLMTEMQQQEALQAWGCRAFYLAAINGHLNILEYLSGLITEVKTLALQVGDYWTFRRTAANGHLNILEHLYSLMNEPQQQKVLQADEYWAFREAAANGHRDVLERLYGWMHETQRQEALQADNHGAFRSAAANGHRDVLERLYGLMSKTQRQEALQADDHGAFRSAAANGHRDILERLYGLMSKTQRQEALQADKHGAFRWAAANGHLTILEHLYALMSETQQQEALQADNYFAFRETAANNHRDVLERLYGLMSKTQRQEALQADKHGAFRRAAANNHRDVLERLYGWMHETQQQEALQADDYFAFRRAATNGHLDILEYLYGLMTEAQQQEALQAYDFNALRFAAANNHRDVLERLYGWMSETQQRQEALQARAYGAFRQTAANGHLNILERLYDWMDEAQVQAALQADDYIAFRSAAANGHLNILERLYGWMSETQQPEALRAYSHGALRGAIEQGHEDVLEYLLRNHQVFAWAEMHITEYGRCVRSFAAARVEEWREASASFMHNNPNGVFTLNEADSRLAFYVARHLVRENTEAASGQLRFLLDIPGVATLAHQAVTPGRENELLRLALTLGNQGAAEILLTLEPVRALAEAHAFYAREAQGGIDLRTIAEDRESSMRALAPGERRRLERVNTHYGPTIRFLGADNILAVLREHLRERYRVHPASITLNGSTVILPPAWQEFQNLGLEGEARTRALEAYARNADHTALRWMLKPNPWMAANAAHVAGNPGAHTGYSTYGNYRDLIALLWCAASDEDTSPTGGHTPEGRIDHFVRELALIGRAHNWDRRRPLLRADDGHVLEEEEYDDLEGDKPSCYSGVKRRLFQSVIGHPLIQPFGNDVLEAELRDFVRSHFTARITLGNHASLLGAKEAIEVGEPLSEDQLQAMKDRVIVNSGV